MSLSKEKADASRQPKCARCRGHGLVVPQKGHSNRCPYARCSCWKCALITERTRINALHRKLYRETEESSGSECAVAPQLQPDTGPAPEEVPPQPATGLGHPRPREEKDREAGPCDPPPPSPRQWDFMNHPLFWRNYSPLPLPFLHLQVQVPAPFPYQPNLLMNTPWSPVPPLPPGLCEGGLSRLTVPPYHPPPEAGPLENLLTRPFCPQDFRASTEDDDEKLQID